jgi:hypothetical protein
MPWHRRIGPGRAGTPGLGPRGRSGPIGPSDPGRSATPEARSEARGRSRRDVPCRLSGRGATPLSTAKRRCRRAAIGAQGVARGPSGRTSRSGRPASDRPSGREGEPPTRHRRGATPPSSVRCKSARDARLGGAGSPAARRAKERTWSSPDGGEHPTAASGGRRAACSDQRMRRRRTTGSSASDRRPRRRKGPDEPSRHYRWLAPRFGRRAAKEWPVDSRCASPAPITRKRLRTASRARR